MANINAGNIEAVLSSGITANIEAVLSSGITATELTSIKSRLTALEAIVPTPKAADEGKALVAGDDGTASWTTVR